MDPNPKRFPILSYVMSHLQSTTHQVPEHDIEATDPSSFSPTSPRHFEVELVDRMPHLRHPDLLASMVSAVSDVTHTRSILQALGDRPNHETLDSARSHISDIDVAVIHQLDEIGHDGADLVEREKECRIKADAQKLPYNAVLKLDEMHEAYEKLLKEAEERLEKIYVSSSGSNVPVRQGDEEGDEQLNEKVVATLQEASVKCVERVELSGQQLRFLPEAFGRVHGLVILNVSNNQLEVGGNCQLGDSIFSPGFTIEIFHNWFRGHSQIFCFLSE